MVRFKKHSQVLSNQNSRNFYDPKNNSPKNYLRTEVEAESICQCKLQRHRFGVYAVNASSKRI
jgi:hypothetical protein